MALYYQAANFSSVIERPQVLRHRTKSDIQFLLEIRSEDQVLELLDASIFSPPSYLSGGDGGSTVIALPLDSLP